MAERVVLVDENDAEVGTEEKLRAHLDGRLHRALSVFVADSAGRLLLQRRAAGKYHSGGQWTNTCCSHPRPGEPVDAAARRRLAEEMGMECELLPAFRFVYRADVGGGLTEAEYDHVFVGRFDGEPSPNPDEVDGWRWASLRELAAELAAEPERFTPWFRIVMGRPDLLDALGLGSSDS
jgi:isopentenyl-diphosphate delta-isomerase